MRGGERRARGPARGRGVGGEKADHYKVPLTLSNSSSQDAPAPA